MATLFKENSRLVKHSEKKETPKGTFTTLQFEGVIPRSFHNAIAIDGVIYNYVYADKPEQKGESAIMIPGDHDLVGKDFEFLDV